MENVHDRKDKHMKHFALIDLFLAASVVVLTAITVTRAVSLAQIGRAPKSA